MKRLHFSLLVCLALVGAHEAPRASAAAPANASPVYEYKDLDTQPTPKRPIRVRYPSGIRKKGETAEIVLRFVVTKKGTVTNLTVVRFSNPGMIDPAMESYEEAQFIPGTKNGAPVDAWVEVTDYSPPK